MQIIPTPRNAVVRLKPDDFDGVYDDMPAKAIAAA